MVLGHAVLLSKGRHKALSLRESMQSARPNPVGSNTKSHTCENFVRKPSSVAMVMCVLLDGVCMFCVLRSEKILCF